MEKLVVAGIWATWPHCVCSQECMLTAYSELTSAPPAYSYLPGDSGFHQVDIWDDHLIGKTRNQNQSAQKPVQSNFDIHLFTAMRPFFTRQSSSFCAFLSFADCSWLLQHSGPCCMYCLLASQVFGATIWVIWMEGIPFFCWKCSGNM